MINEQLKLDTKYKDDIIKQRESEILELNSNIDGYIDKNRDLKIRIKELVDEKDLLDRANKNLLTVIEDLNSKINNLNKEIEQLSAKLNNRSNMFNNIISKDDPNHDYMQVDNDLILDYRRENAELKKMAKLGPKRKDTGDSLRSAGSKKVVDSSVLKKEFDDYKEKTKEKYKYLEKTIDDLYANIEDLSKKNKIAEDGLKRSREELEIAIESLKLENKKCQLLDKENQQLNVDLDILKNRLNDNSVNRSPKSGRGISFNLSNSPILNVVSLEESKRMPFSITGEALDNVSSKNLIEELNEKLKNKEYSINLLTSTNKSLNEEIDNYEYVVKIKDEEINKLKVNEENLLIQIKSLRHTVQEKDDVIKYSVNYWDQD